MKEGCPVQSASQISINASVSRYRGCLWTIVFALTLLFTACGHSKNSNIAEVQKGDPSHKGGTATVREPYTPKEDDPNTSNDESNDQPLGHMGSVTIYAYNSSSGNTYTLDADVEGGEVQRLYFPRGGWVDFNSSEIDSDGNGSGTDENGRLWEFRGLAAGSISDEIKNSSVDEPEEEDL